jgi:hypothetical protein
MPPSKRETVKQQKQSSRSLHSSNRMMAADGELSAKITVVKELTPPKPLHKKPMSKDGLRENRIGK